VGDGSERDTLYLSSNIILLQIRDMEVSDDKGEGGLVYPAKVGLLPTASGVWGLSCIQSSTSPGDIGTGSYPSMEMGSCLDIGDGSLGKGGSCI
jgi:hypothetical protein